jgi:Tfp pilus assembly protein FimT
MRTSPRRLGAVALSVALVASPALVATPAQAATNAYSYSAAGWLSRQLTGGLVHNGQYDFDDYGLSLDVFLALDALGTRSTAAASVLNAVDDDPGAYIGAGTESYAGATGKLATAVELAGRNPRSFGGVNLVARLQQRVHTAADAQRGRGTDESQYGDFSNTIGQSFVVRGLSGGRSNMTGEAVDFLVKQQCAAGFFREAMESVDFTCDGGTAAQSAPSVDATGFAVQALVAARSNGTKGLDGAIRKAASWLVRTQRTNGSFVGNGVANTNTTGLAATALSLAGRPVAAERAAAWVSRRQVTYLVAANSPRLAHETGAIAYTSTQLATGRTEGITTDQRDQWRRATAQAAIGVNAVKRLRVVAPAGPRHRLTRVSVHVSHLAPRERWTVRLGTIVVDRGRATSRGYATATFRLPKRVGRYDVRALGASSARTGRDTVRVVR